MKVKDVQNMPKEVTKRHNFVSKRLKNLWKEDEYFRNKFQSIFEYHKSKLFKVLGNRVNHEDFFDPYHNYITDLFYQGYYLGRELVENQDVLIADRFFEQPNGIIREQTYDILSGAAGDLADLVSHEDSLAYEQKLITENEAVGPVLLQAKIDTVTLGTYQALLDERSSKNLFVTPELGDEFRGLLHRSDDLLFVDPQKYFICLLTNGHSEVWDLNLWQTIPARSRTIGRVHISVYEPETTNKMVEKLPFYQGYEGLKKDRKTVTISLSLTERISEKEQLPIIASMVESIKNRLNIEYEDIQVSLSVTEKISNYQYSPVPQEEE
ncbi:hypothetical protein [Virgibacillus halodenitrificans]|uniref:hypothetical protein n=1 Tax=Virgibacillus halodenitrificans TaxID=1482 RepID=UPI000EF45EC7|nr:hypothetical protein [Virgibacillus halodenitrificans]